MAKLKTFNYIFSQIQVKRPTLRTCTAASNRRMAQFQRDFLLQKTRVAPVETVSLPRLELCGALLGTKLMNVVIESLQSSKLTIDSTRAWTNSTIALQWLDQLPRTWTTFAANRVSEIQGSMPRAKWNHIPSQQNPADLSSRGMEVNDYISSNLWWQFNSLVRSHDMRGRSE